jgi:hypothetical protein
MVRLLTWRRLAIFFVALVSAAFVAGAASADPVNKGLPVTLTCGGSSISTVTNGNGQFTPAHDTNSTATFIPLQFGEVTDVFTDPEGHTTTNTEPPSPPKGSANPPNKTVLDCTFHADVHGPEGGHLVVDGEVTGYFAR